MSAKAATASPKAARSKTATSKTATPWGTAAVVEELHVAQRAGERRFSSVVQLLEGPKGEQFVRIAYSTGGSVRRGPVTLRARDVERLHEALRTRPQIARALGLGESLGIELGGDA